MTKNQLRAIIPEVGGWLEKTLSDQEMNFLWKCIENRKESIKHTLAGSIHGSNKLIDEDNWFWENTLLPLANAYAKQFTNLGDNIPVNQYHPYYLQSFWVNYQKQTEFNPPHNHNGVYSFVIWMKIPTRHFDQNKIPFALNSNTHKVSSFEFQYSDIHGTPCYHNYEMNPDVEGKMLFFPSKLIHQVYPFYNSEEDRISISGNVSLDTRRLWS